MRRLDGRLAGLLGLAAASPVLETAVLDALNFQGAEGLAPQGSAVWPYDSYHDMRWLLVYHDSWLVFGLGLLGVVVLRGLISATLIRLAWSEGVSYPSFPRLLVRNLAVAALTAAIVSPFAALAVAAAVVSLSWFLFASLLPMLLLAPFLQRAAVGTGWWRGLPSVELVGWSLLDFVAITVAGALVWRAPGRWALVVAVACGLANGVLWNRTVRAAVLPSYIRWRRVPAAPLAVLLALIVPLAAQSLASVGPESRRNFRSPVLNSPLPASVRHAVIVLAGHDSAYDGKPPVDPAVEQFSYAGRDAQGRPLPYASKATHRSLESSADLLAAQVDALHGRTNRPVALLGESEGAMVARTYLARVPQSPVTALLMFSPLVRAGRNYYPPPGGKSGWGVAAGWELRVIFTAVNLASGTKNSPDEPFVRSLLQNASFYRYQVLCPIEGVRVIAFLPTVSAAEAETPPGPYSRIPVFETPALHGGLLGRSVIHDKLIDFLGGENLNAPRREYGYLQALGVAWQAPTLAITANPVWRPAVPSSAPPFSPKRRCQTL